MQDITGHEVYLATGGEFGAQHQSDFYSPAISVLPMGFGWSFYLVQCIQSHLLDIPQQQLILDGFPAPVLEEGGCVAMPYCDNSHVVV